MAFSGTSVDPLVGVQSINITAAETVENYTVYIIEVQVGAHKWTVRHRYSEFNLLHEKLVSQYGVKKDLLPPKKFFGSQSESFIQRRRKELEVYLQALLNKYTLHAIPQELAVFLETKNYDIHGIVQCLAEELFLKGDLILQAEETFHVTPLQLHAITSRLKLPEPTCDSGDTRKDIGHILDFATHIKYIKVNGSSGKIGSSNIEAEHLPFDLSYFRSLEVLEINNCNTQMISGIDNIRKSVKTLRIHDTVECIKEILLLDILYWESGDDMKMLPEWKQLTSLDFSHNNITAIDHSIQLAPEVAYLDLSYNTLSSLDHLETLTLLSHLDLSHNGLSVLPPLHMHLGNIKSLNLSSNKLDSLEAVSKLYSLESLDISHNQISEAIEVKHVSSLPCLENILLLGNPVTVVIDYRTRILELFRERALEVCLDRQRPSQKEIDTVLVLLAIQKSRGVKERNRQVSSKKHAVEVSISESDEVERSGHEASGEDWHVSETASVSSDHGGYRGQLEMLREREGVGWLSALNKLHAMEEDERHFQQKEMIREQRYTPESWQNEIPEDSCRSSFAWHRALPGIHDPAFMQYLQQLIPVTAVSQQDHGRQVTDLSQLILWCPCLSYTKPSEEWSACVFLSSSTVHLLQVQSFQDCQAVPTTAPSTGDSRNSSQNFPILSHVYSVLKKNIQQVVVGIGSLFLRIEEAFTGPQGTFTLLLGDPTSAQLILQNLCSVEEEDIDIKHTDIAKVNAVLKCENQFEVYSLVYLKNAESKRAYTHSVVVTPKDLLVVHEDFIHWPETTFSMTKPSHSQYRQECRFPFNEYMFLCESYTELIWDDKQQTLYQFGVKLTAHSREKLENEKVVNLMFLYWDTRENFLITLDKFSRNQSTNLSPPRACTAENLTQISPKDKNAPVKIAADHMTGEKEGFEDGHQQTDTDLVDLTETIPKSETHSVKESSPVVHQKTPITYPKEALVKHLQECLSKKALLYPLSKSLSSFSLLSGEELINYFHNSVAEIGTEREELHHVLWTSVIPYTCPLVESLACVMLSNRAVYILSDKSLGQNSRNPVWKKHSRHQSDSMIRQREHGSNKGHHTAGILHMLEQPRPGMLRVSATLPLTELCQVNIGLFEQAFRLVGETENSCYICVTRDLSLTDAFICELMSVLSELELSKSTEVVTPTDGEMDFYKAYRRADSCEVVHPSQVRFIYPNEEMISDIRDTIGQQILGCHGNTDILMYCLVVQAVSGAEGSPSSTYGDIATLDTSQKFSRTLVLTNTHVCIAEEDLVTYPLPHFEKGLPSSQHFVMKEVRNMEYLKRIVLSDFNSRDVCLVFADQSDAVVVDPMMDYYSSQSDKVRGKDILPEVSLTVFIQTERDKNKFIKIMCQSWAELHNGAQLSVQVST